MWREDGPRADRSLKSISEVCLCECVRVLMEVYERASRHSFDCLLLLHRLTFFLSFLLLSLCEHTRIWSWNSPHTFPSLSLWLFLMIEKSLSLAYSGECRADGRNGSMSKEEEGIKGRKDEEAQWLCVSPPPPILFSFFFPLTL